MGLALRPPVRLTNILLVLSLSGCVGDLVDITQGPVTAKDAGGGGGQDAAPAPAGDAGTQAAIFNPTINADIQGCTATQGCHGGTQIPLLKTGTDAATISANYTSFSTEAKKGAGGEMSLVLLKNLALAAGGTAHAGGNGLFPSKTDPKYVLWLAWINAKYPEQ